MHAIQTSGNCIRNITADHFAGVAADEIDDPRAVVRDRAPVVDAAPRIHASCRASSRSPSPARRNDRAAVRGARHRPAACGATTTGEIGFEVIVGGGLGRTPMIGTDDPRVPAAATSCSPISRRSCASTTATAGATTSTRRASRSWCTRSAPRSSREEVEAECAAIDGQRARLCPRPRARPHPRSSRRRRFEPKRPARSERRGAEARRTAASPLWLKHNVAPHKRAGLRHRRPSR